MYNFIQSKSFTKKLKKLIASKRLKYQELERSFRTLAENPFNPSLNTHKVVTRKHKKHYSSRLDRDLRIIWDFDEKNNLVLYLLDIGGHSGSTGVY